MLLFVPPRRRCFMRPASSIQRVDRVEEHDLGPQPCGSLRLGQSGWRRSGRRSFAAPVAPAAAARVVGRDPDGPPSRGIGS